LQSEIEFDNDYDNTRYLDGTEEKRASVYCTDLWFQEAMAWMTQQKQMGKPFFTYLALNVAHLPFWPPKKYENLYKEKARQPLAQYYGMIAGLDDSIGQMDEWLKKSGLFRDTIVVFMSDNGSAFAGGAFFVDTGQPVYNAGLRDGKSSNYEGGHRTVCYMRYPGGGFDVDRNIDTPTQIQDVLPLCWNFAKCLPGRPLSMA